MKSKPRIQPIHPGDFLRETLAERGITADTALRLGLYFGTSPELWLNLQNTYDLSVARLESADKIAREVIPASQHSS